jgi:hypothetical protein
VSLGCNCLQHVTASHGHRLSHAESVFDFLNLPESLKEQATEFLDKTTIQSILRVFQNTDMLLFFSSSM